MRLTHIKLFAAISLLSVPLHAQFYIDEKPCFQELQTSFFRPDLVMEALSLHAVVQNQWMLINQKLKEKSQGVPSLLKERARQMELNGERNPLLYPFQPAGADKLLNQILMEIFISVLNESNVTNPPFNIKAMFDYIRNKQADRIKACLGLDTEESMPPAQESMPPAQNSMPK